MAADLVVIVFSSGPGTRFGHHFGKIYYAGEEEAGGGRDTLASTKPIFGDEIQRSKHLTPEQAVSVRNMFRGKGHACHIEDRFGNLLYEREQSVESRYDDKRSRQFVPFTNGLGLIVVPGNTPLGPAWFVRASDVPTFADDGSHVSRESIHGVTPQDAAQRAVDTWGTQILFADPEVAAKAEAEAAAQRQVSENFKYRYLRPGDRR